jgi:hypothetical protein
MIYNITMGMVCRREKRMLTQLVEDCAIYGLNEHESLEYIKKRSGGLTVSRSTFFSIRRRVTKNEVDGLQERLSGHARVGFALAHFNHIDEINNIQKILLQTLVDEANKHIERRNLLALSRIASNMLENIQTLRELNLDTPFLNQIKSEIDNARKLRQLEKPKLPYGPHPESALVIDIDSIAGKPTGLTNEQMESDEPVVE